ncbi:MAG TPA: hypothetical protein VF574_11495 [Allosphingosinicella sp.]|jgi:hypothetical protein
MESSSKRRVAGGAFLAAAALLFGRETLSWAWDQALDGLTHGLSAKSIAAFPWQTAGATVLVAVGVLLLLWPSKPKPRKLSSEEARAERLRKLSIDAERMVHRIRDIREVKWLRQETGDEIVDLTRDGQSLLLTFAKAGLPIPKFTTNSAQRVLIGQHEFFSTLGPPLRDGHLENIDALAGEVAARAEQAALSFDLETWYVRRL